jgi:hypothetical protein
MNLPFQYNKGKVFVRYGGHWINIPLSVMSHGGGLKGYYRFFKGWILCAFGKHSFGHVYSMKDRKRHVICQYCKKEKEHDNQKSIVV